MVTESKDASPRKVLGSISGCFWKKSIKTRSSAFEFARDLMSIDVHLLNCLIGSSMSWHRAISSFVRIIGIVKVM